MGDRPAAPGRAAARLSSGSITIVGLGPSGLERVSGRPRELLLDGERQVIVRTLRHPAAQQLEALRPVASGDDLYQAAATLEDVYPALADRVVAAAAAGAAVVLAVPGSPLVGEATVPLVQQRAAAASISVEVVPGESFLDLVLAEVGVDPLARGLQVLDGRDLPDPLPLHLPTVIAQVDVPAVLDEVRHRLGRVLPGDASVIVLSDLGSHDARVETVPVAQLALEHAGLRTTLYVDPEPAGILGVIQTMRRLRAECPWDRSQTHHSLVTNLIEEAYELVEALSALPRSAPAGDVDFAAYAEVEDELGDVLLQVLFHTTMAEQAGAFDIEDVAETLRRKLVRRHPHVFGDAAAETPEEVLHSWERIKREEKGQADGSRLGEVARGVPALTRAGEMQRRAASVGFDWDAAEPVGAKLGEEVAELREVLDRPTEAEWELGDLLFSLVNLARHLGLDPEVALRKATDRFEQRFRHMESLADLDGLTLEQLDELWERAKDAEEKG